MTQRDLQGRLELTWMGKDQALIPTREGAYDYAWVDKNDPRACQTHYLISDGHVGNPRDGGLHDNMLVTGESGDILEALTRVPELAERYVGRVKCVYIDPPFNTGGVFAHYEDNLEHSVWLTFMRDRLVLLKKLLSDDGSIWVHLDDSENHRMRALLDEEFGPGNFVAEVVWQKADSPRRGAGFSVDQDVIIVYRKSDAFSPNKSIRTEEHNARFTNPDNDPNGPWWDDNPSGNHGDGSGGMCYAIQSPMTGKMLRPPRGSSWRYSQLRILAGLNEWAPYKLENLNDAEWRADNEGVPHEKASNSVCALVLDVPLEEARRLVEARRSAGPLPEILIRASGGIGRKAYVPEDGNNPRTWWANTEVGHNRQAKSEIKALFPGKKLFDTPKPERLLERIIRIATNPGDIVLDCFAGSGTTAAVAHKLGRRWVTCELSENNVATFTKPRLEKVVAGADSGGVTTTVIYEADTELPGNTTVAEARSFNTVLGRVLAQLKESGIEFDNDKIRALRDATSTKKISTVQWAGGGGFSVHRLSPVWVGVDEDPYSSDTKTFFITPEATGDVLERSVAAHLGFRLTPESPRFTGVKGRQWLAVLEGQLSGSLLSELLVDLPKGHSLTVVCDGAAPNLDRELRRRAPGSRLLQMPDDLFKATGGTA
ncbi:site-specific DNA-methyltransferase [Cryobacterium algoricola]|uniref:Site-specific DNA-methyltransferase n=1 Tax=Cryobacterium algoricola TaxID=1259183 RepID=A0ABY2IE22_9MICO|nr:site-specific DNA-methyltransferase [Cryobacterium algoricola]TFB86877.1 site-specific DNA-methyltransferase [Cryobacterium algoricola]